MEAFNSRFKTENRSLFLDAQTLTQLVAVVGRRMNYYNHGGLASVLISPTFWLSPIVLAYYTLAYSSFIALPLLFIDEELLWKEPTQAQRHSIPYFWVLGFVLALAIRIFWGLVYGPLVTSLFRLSAR